MFYRPKDGHGLPHNPFNAIVTPRPIGWISTRSPEGQDNLAPYSFFNGIAYTPPQVMFASTSAKADRQLGKDSLDNIRQTGEFCVNIVAYEQRDAMNATSGLYEREVDEFELAGIERAPCTDIACARVAASPAALECRLVQIVDLLGEANHMVIGEVVAVHIDDTVMSDGLFDVLKYQPLTRLGYRDYSRVTEVFSLKRPGE
ncbi:flavin reductase family protein [Brevirhabdus sp.]|uniref:flavin reductase family protein n=1 Tax=Brevirhabdus sp. TaxID=2004514 RepID=UPI00405953DD